MMVRPNPGFQMRPPITRFSYWLEWPNAFVAAALDKTGNRWFQYDANFNLVYECTTIVFEGFEIRDHFAWWIHESVTFPSPAPASSNLLSRFVVTSKKVQTTRFSVPPLPFYDRRGVDMVHLNLNLMLHRCRRVESTRLTRGGAAGRRPNLARNPIETVQNETLDLRWSA